LNPEDKDILKKIFNHPGPGSVFALGPGLKAMSFHWDKIDSTLTFEAYLRKLANETVEKIRRTRTFFSSLYFWTGTELVGASGSQPVGNPLYKALTLLQMLDQTGALGVMRGMATDMIGTAMMIEMGKSTKPLLEPEVLERESLVTVGISKERMVLVSVILKRIGKGDMEVLDTEVSLLDRTTGLEKVMRPLPQMAKYMDKLRPWEGRPDEPAPDRRRFRR
jgi:hypothetical protein